MARKLMSSKWPMGVATMYKIPESDVPIGEVLRKLNILLYFVVSIRVTISNMKNIFNPKGFLPIILVLLLAACGSAPVRDSQPRDMGMSLYQQGRYFDAIPHLERRLTAGADAAEILALAVSYRQIGESIRIYPLLNRTELRGLPETQILRAQLALDEGSCSEALQWTQSVDLHEVSYVWQQAHWQVMAACGSGSASGLAAAEALWRMGQGQQQNSDDLVRALLAVDDTTLLQALGEVHEPEWRGWLEAAFIQFGADGESGEQWLLQWSGHPAAAYFLDQSEVLSRQKVAVLLPFSGRFEAVAKSVQKGLLAASLSMNRSTELLFFDTGSDGEAVMEAWYNAQDQAVDFIIGPLDKASISQLATMPESHVPMLLLNQAEMQVPQFTLSPEAEAADVAEKMFADGHRQVLIMAANDSWGERMTLAFAQRFADLGGGVIKNQYFDATQHDYSAQLQQMLGLVESRLRTKKLQSYLKLSVGAQEVVRSDVDAIFLAAQPEFARLMVPQLKFHHAQRVPVYSSSHVFVGFDQKQHNKDLEGVQFPLAPLQLQTGDLLEALPFDIKGLKGVDLKLFALGYDALFLANRLEWMQRFSSGRLNGLSGQLSMDNNGIVRRHLAWAHYTGGEIFAQED